MADRPSVKEILALIRAGGPARVEAESVVEETVSEPEVKAEPPARPAKPAALRPAPVATGRPLSLKEKLAAARNAPPAEGEELAATSAPAAASASEAEAATAPAVPGSAAPHLTPEALGRPLTLKEKLAAAKAGGATAGAAPAKAASAAAKPSATAASAKTAPARAVPPLEKSTDPRDLAEHLRRTGAEREQAVKSAAVKAAPAKPAAKKAESKVVPPRPDRETAGVSGSTRRQLFKVGFWIAAGWAAFTAGMGTLLAMSARFFFPNVLAEPPSTIKVGSPTDFEAGQVEERWKAEWGFWIVRSAAYDGEDKIYALSSICTHLGCPPNWLVGEQKFKCPCHGSGFYISGVNFEGPAPRPLERYKVTIGDDGQLVVDKSLKFQEELGQWKDPESFLKV